MNKNCVGMFMKCFSHRFKSAFDINVIAIYPANNLARRLF